jgi:hypothetical protein
VFGFVQFGLTRHSQLFSLYPFNIRGLVNRQKGVSSTTLMRTMLITGFL